MKRTSAAIIPDGFIMHYTVRCYMGPSQFWPLVVQEKPYQAVSVDRSTMVDIITDVLEDSGMSSTVLIIKECGEGA